MLRRRDHGPFSTSVLVLCALVALGAAATWLSWRQEIESVRLQDVRAADLAVSQLSGTLRESVGAIRGVDALAVDGAVDDAEFDAFARGVLGETVYPALAFAEVMTPPARAAFEEDTGLLVRDTDGAGGFVGAAERDPSFVVVNVYPLTDQTRPLLGFDIAGDPTRAAAALAAERAPAPVISDRILTATDARVGFSVVSAVRTTSGDPIGFVTSGVAIDELMDQSGVDLASFASFSLSMDGQALLGTPAGGASQTFSVSGRTFEVVVDEAGKPNFMVPVIIGTAVAMLAVAVARSLRRDRRQRLGLALAARRSRGIADLGRQLAASTDSRSVVAGVVRLGASILDAQHINVARRSYDTPPTLIIEHDPDIAPAVASHVGVQQMDSSLPLTDCVRTGAPVVLTNLDQYAEQYPELLGEVRAAGISSVVCVPLMFSDDICIGALGFAWAAPASSHEATERTIGATTIAELTSRALERAVITEVVQSRASNLSTFARALATAHTAADVARAVSTLVPSTVGAQSAELDFDSGNSSVPGDIRRAVIDPRGRTIAHLVARWRSSSTMGTTQHAVLTTIGEMVGQTLARTALSEQEHQLIVQLQQDLLPEPMVVEGLDIAVRYRPAMSVLGLGGDFYDVIVSDTGHIHLVIGDVTGHGTEAVAAMAELKAVMQHLLRSDASLEIVCAQADLILARRAVFATAQIAEIDPVAQTLRYINAGHPYPVVRRANGATELLLGGHRPLLGLAQPTPPAAITARVPFAGGDLLVLYTDGLIERRTRSLDFAMEQLCASVRDGDGELEAMSDLVSRLLRITETTDTADRIDDDIAIIGARCRG